MCVTRCGSTMCSHGYHENARGAYPSVQNASATSPYAPSSTSFLIVSSSADESPSLLAHVSSALDHVQSDSSSQPSLSPS